MTVDPDQLERFRLRRCPECGYDMRGSRESERCPECGCYTADALLVQTPVRGAAAAGLAVGGLIALTYALHLAVRGLAENDIAIGGLVPLGIIALGLALHYISRRGLNPSAMPLLLTRRGCRQFFGPHTGTFPWARTVAALPNRLDEGSIRMRRARPPWVLTLLIQAPAGSRAFTTAPHRPGRLTLEIAAPFEATEAEANALLEEVNRRIDAAREIDELEPAAPTDSNETDPDMRDRPVS